MKKYFSLAMLLLIATLYFTLPARADVIWEPLGDRFFEEHRSEMTYMHYKKYEANGPKGRVLMYKDPYTNRVLKEYENGQEIIINWVMTDTADREWGLTAFFDERTSSSIPVWVPMDYLFRVYGSAEFKEEYADQLVKKGGNITKFYDKYCYEFSYPGGPFLRKNDISHHHNYVHYNLLFTDEDGRTWGCNENEWNAGNWFLIDRPEAPPSIVYPNGAPGRDTLEKPVWPDDTEEIVPLDDNPLHTLPIGVIWGVVGVVVLSAAALIIMLKQKHIRQ